MLTTRRPVLASSGSMSSAPVRPNRLARKPDTKTEAKTDVKTDTFPTDLIAETPATQPHQIFETRTPAKTLARATLAPPAPASVSSIHESDFSIIAPAATVSSIHDSEALSRTNVAAIVPDILKRVSWSENNMPVDRLARKPDTKTEAKADIKTDTLSTDLIAETPATQLHQTFETRTSAKTLAKAASASAVTGSSIIDAEALSMIDVAAIVPDILKRVSWSKDDMPVEFSSANPPNEVSTALIGKTLTGPVDTITRNPVNGKTTNPVGKVSASLANDKTSSSDRQMFRCPSDGTLASLPVEPSELPASETTHLSVDGTFNIPAPEVAALATPRMPRRSSLKSSNQPNVTREQGANADATSNTVHNNSKTTAPTSIEVDSQPPQFGIATKLSPSPRPLASRKEGLKSAVERRRLKVYEDEDEMSEDIWLTLALERGSPPPSPTPDAKAVLSELPVNTEITKRRNSFSAKMTTDQNVSIHQTRQVIGRAIPRMQDATLDHEGFKNLRALIHKDDLWATGEEGQPIFDDLVQSLSFIIQGDSPYNNMDHEKLKLLRLQAIYTINVLHTKNKPALAKWSQHILRSLAVSYEDYPNDTATPFSRIRLMTAGLADKMIDLADQDRNLDTLFKLLESNTPLERNILALQLLGKALLKGNGKVDQMTEARLGRLTCLCIGDLDTDVRMAGTTLASRMYVYVRPESRFWGLLVELSEEQKNLVTYYVSKK